MKSGSGQYLLIKKIPGDGYEKIEEILIVTGRNKRAIEDHFDKWVELELELKKKGQGGPAQPGGRHLQQVDIHFIRRKEPRGLGHAIYCARTFVGESPLPSCWETM